MLINGSIATDKTDRLINEYVSLLNKGVSSAEILVLVQNSNLRNEFRDKVLEKLEISCFEKLQIHSFNSLVYNTISDNWAFIEGANPYNNPVIIPNLAGLEVSQYILNEIIKEIKFKGYNSKKSLLHQIFRRYSLIVQNNLSDDEVEERAKILKEGFSDDVKSALKKFLQKTLELRDFDYLRQILIFNYVYARTDYFKNIKYLILDDGDEITPVCFEFIRHLARQLKDVFIGYDSIGGSRSGYLSADRMAVWEFEKLFNEKAQIINNDADERALKIYENVKFDKKNALHEFFMNSPSKRSSMIDMVTKKINELIDSDVLPCEISIVTPIEDEMLKFTLKENLKDTINLKFISGNEKLIQNPLVYAAITILKLNSDMKTEVSNIDIRNILSNFLGIQIKYCGDILKEFDCNKELPPYDFGREDYNEKYEKFLKLSENLKTEGKKLSEQVIDIFNTFENFRTLEPEKIIKFNFFVKELQDFENIFGKNFDGIKNKVLERIENSIISENPASSEEFGKQDLIIGTPQKIIDNKIKTEYSFWLDISSSEWIKSDTGPLYNAWVFQKGWEKDEYTVEDNIELSKEKTAKILRKLALLNTDKIYCYSSLFDGNGVENFGGIEEYIITENSEGELEKDSPAKPIIPRSDQKPVLEYKRGKMAISAVPGAGKTTILLALIIKLLDAGINPENIFVMTYMESAARNFRERIKNIKKESSKLPNISTIHGLALRILKENGNYERLNLSGDFEICDDTQKSRILKTAAEGLKLKKKELEEFERGISIIKISNGEFPKTVQDKKMADFKRFYEIYQGILSENNLIDYDDMLISSVRLLKENPDILEYYQNICHYIIEDEAQDSSSIQQELINLLSGKHKNLIRCGDINQAITTTFSNADVEGFRKFINESNDVRMDCSQRCSKEVYELANSLVNYAKNNVFWQNAFFDIQMKPVSDKNPDIKNAVSADLFVNEQDERNNVIKEIRKALKDNPKSTIGILLRYNYQVGNWQNFINNSGFKSITRSECLEQKTVFKVIFAVLKLIQNPFDNFKVSESYEILAESGFYKTGLGAEISKYEKPFISVNSDGIKFRDLEQFHWDFNWWVSFSHLSVAELVIKIGLYYFSNETEISNVYLISTLVKRLAQGKNDINYIIEQLEILSKKSSLSGFKFFSQEDESDKSYLEGKVQIMTMHKSKGDEFDYVFIPELHEKSYTLLEYELNLKNNDFLESLKRLNPKYKPKTDAEIKKEQIEETLRLLYVGITRAKKHLKVSASKRIKSFGRLKDEKESVLFDTIFKSRTVQHE